MGSGRSFPPPPPVPSPARGAPPPSTNGWPAPAPQGSTLTLIYNGERHPITKERFVIGRGKQSSDLMLKDPNVSRQHAVVEFLDGAYFMVDMGSTNGVSFNGERLARQPIAEGDTFRICDHDLMFTYR
jgi:pSer/pThr/pTyr-binding forkhead associated (FHA) protein